MRKSIWIIVSLLILAVWLPASAERHTVILKYERKNKDDRHTRVNRTPMRLPIEVVYDSDSNVVEVFGPEELGAEVYIYNDRGILEDYSATLEATLTLSTRGVHIICINGDGWSAEGEVEAQ